MSAFLSRLDPLVRHSVARDMFLAAASQASSRGALIVSGIVVSHFLGQEAFAEYSFLVMTASLVTTAASMGLGIVAGRAAATGLLEPARTKSSRFPALVVLTTISSLVAFSAALLLPASWLRLDTPLERGVLAALTGLGVIVGVLIGLMHGIGRFDVVARATALGSLGAVGGAMIGSAFGTTSVAIIGLVVTPVVVVSLVAPVLLRKVLSLRPNLGIMRFSTAGVKDLLVVALPILLTSLISIGAFWWGGRQLLLGSNGSLEFGLYAIGLHWFAAVLFLPGALSTALIPRLFGASNEADHSPTARVRTLAIRSAIAASAIAILAAVGVIALQLSGVLSWSYGVTRNALLPVMLLFMVAAVFAAICAVIGNAVIAKEGAVSWLVGMTLWATIFALTSEGLFKQRSASGLSASLAAAYAALSLYGLWAATKRPKAP